MKKSTKVLKALNKCFKKPVHPFNLNNEGKLTYAQWQYEKGENTLKYYLEKYSYGDVLTDKEILDIGCGAAGKSLYYAAKGAKFVTGVDVVGKYEAESAKLAKEKGLENKFKFILADAKSLPFGDQHFDTIIMNDAFEHVADPAAVIKECIRVLKKGGRLFINFPPYNHPFGAHLSDAISIPWVHLFFSDETLIEAYKDLVSVYPDHEDRLHFRISKDENKKEYFSYINKMTIKKARKILSEIGIVPAYYKEVPLRKFFSPLCHIPKMKECFVKMVVMVIEK